MTLVTDDLVPVEFASVLASSVHDMKNSIGHLLNSAEAIESLVPDNSIARDQVLALQHEARRINFDLMHLLGLYKFERSRQVVNPSVVDCEEFLLELTAYNESLLTSRGLKFAAECRGAVEGFFDRDLIMGILNSTLNNTYNFAESEVEVSCETIEGYTVFSVRDDGPGYGLKVLKGGGEQMGRTDYATGSTGLGLYFARRITEMHCHRGRPGKVVLDNEGIRGGGRLQLWLP